MIIAIATAFYQEQKADKNVYIVLVAIGVFMLGMMKLSAKTPSKNIDKKEENVQ